MFTLCAESFDMMKADVTSGKNLSTAGKIVHSKLVNRLFWYSYGTPDVVKETLDAEEPMPLFDPQTVPMDWQSVQQMNRADYELLNSASDVSVLEIVNKDILWDYLSLPNTDEDGCGYCANTPIEKQLFPKHEIYTNGTLTCPVLLALKITEPHNTGKRHASKQSKDCKRDRRE